MKLGRSLFTDNGVSGPPVLQLSRAASVALHEHRSPQIVLDMFPNLDLEQLDAVLAARFEQQGKKTLAFGLVGLLNKRLIPVILEAAGIADPSVPCAALPSRRAKTSRRIA